MDHESVVVSVFPLDILAFALIRGHSFSQWSGVIEGAHTYISGM